MNFLSHLVAFVPVFIFGIFLGDVYPFKEHKKNWRPWAWLITFSVFMALSRKLGV